MPEPRCWVADFLRRARVSPDKNSSEIDRIYFSQIIHEEKLHSYTCQVCSWQYAGAVQPMCCGNSKAKKSTMLARADPGICRLTAAARACV